MSASQIAKKTLAVSATGTEMELVGAVVQAQSVGGFINRLVEFSVQ
jgi:hypothetical protein